MRFSIQLGALAAVATLTACATPTYTPPADSPLAEVVVARGLLSANQDAHLYHRGSGTGAAMKFGPAIGFEYDQPYPLAAEVSTVLFTDVMTRVQSWNSFCASGVRFVPKTGVTYRVQATSVANKCTTTVIDTQTGTIPTDLEHISDRESRTN